MGCGEVFELNPVDLFNAGEYTCTVTTEAGTLASNNGELIVHYLPRGTPTLEISNNIASVKM